MTHDFDDDYWEDSSVSNGEAPECLDGACIVMKGVPPLFCDNYPDCSVEREDLPVRRADGVYREPQTVEPAFKPSVFDWNGRAVQRVKRRAARRREICEEVLSDISVWTWASVAILLGFVTVMSAIQFYFFR